MSSKNITKKFFRCGPGGWQCACCFPPRGTKERKKEVRLAKKRAAKEDFRLEQMNEKEDTQ